VASIFAILFSLEAISMFPYLRVGNKKGAIESYKKALELDPDNAEVIELLKKIE
jgi:tetratricopeptide (TPR) repeat protein